MRRVSISDPSFTYDPDHSYLVQPPAWPKSFTDSFTYKATDGVAESNVAKVKITVCEYMDPSPPAACVHRSLQQRTGQ